MSSPELSFPHEQELLVSPFAHHVIHSAMEDAAVRILDTQPIERTWQIVGLPISTAVMAGDPTRRYPTDYNFLDMTVRQAVNEDLQATLFFHGHPDRYTTTALMESTGNFSIHPDYAGDRVGNVANVEAHTGIAKGDMFAYLFRLLGHRGIPEAIHDLDEPDFSSNEALHSLLDGLFGNKHAHSSKLTELAQYFSMVGGEIVDIQFIRTTHERAKTNHARSKHETLELRARSTHNLFADAEVEKELTYSFPVGSMPDGDQTSAHIKLSQQRGEPIESEQANVLIVNTVAQTEEGFTRLMRGALSTLDERIAQSRLAD